MILCHSFTAISVFLYYYLCILILLSLYSYTAISVFLYCYLCILLLLSLFLYYYLCILLLLSLYSYSTISVFLYCYLWILLLLSLYFYTVISVFLYYYLCILILLSLYSYTAISVFLYCDLCTVCCSHTVRQKREGLRVFNLHFLLWVGAYCTYCWIIRDRERVWWAFYGICSVIYIYTILYMLCNIYIHYIIYAL